MMRDTSSRPSDEEISLKEIILEIKQWWKYLLSKWIVIVLFGVLGAIIGVGYSFIRKPIYTAVTTFVLENGEKTGAFGQYEGLASLVGGDIGGGGGIFQGDNIMELYKSRLMIQKTLLTNIAVNGRRHALVDRYIDANELKKKWRDKPNLLALTFRPDSGADSLALKPNRLRDSVLATIVEDINKRYLTVVKPDKKLSLIEVTVRSNDEIFAKYFNDAIVKNVNEFYIQTKTKKSKNNVAILQHKTDSVRAVMVGSIYTAAKIADGTPNLNPTRQLQRNAPMQKAQFSADANKGVLNEFLKSLETSKMSLLKETPLIQVVDTPIFPLAKDRLGKLKGLVLGGIIAGILIVIVLILKRVFKSIMN